MNATPRQRLIGWALRALATVMLLLSLPLIVGGAYLVYLGGSSYFLLTGITILLSAILIFRDSVWGIWLYVATVGATLIWSLWEIAGKGWMPV